MLSQTLRQDCAYPPPRADSPNVDLLKQVGATIAGVERIISAGFFLCLFSVLQAFTVVPWQGLLRHKNALLQAALVLVTSACLSHFTVARLYHDLKEQDFIGLTAISKMLDYCEFTLRQYGKHAYSALYSATEPRVIARNFAVSCVYTILHAATLCLCLVAYEASLTTNYKTFVLIVITNSFIELKISLFKRYDKRGLFETLTSDFINRFQLCMYFSVILLKAAALGRTHQILSGVALYLPVAIGIDWLKHFYISNFNTHSPGLYHELFDIGLRQKLSRSRTLQEHTDWDNVVPNELDWASSAVLTMKFSTLPHVCLIIRMAGPVLYQNLDGVDWFLLAIGVILLKYSVSTGLTKVISPPEQCFSRTPQTSKSTE
jgi:hypothetical protein